jgi:hypothetical protein
MLPRLALDRQLLRYIYRNAVSNACKYGKPDGLLDTRVLYNERKGRLRWRSQPAWSRQSSKRNDHQVASIFAKGRSWI